MSKITYESDGALAVVTLSDPPLNLVGADMGAELIALLDRIEKDRYRGMILKNDEGNFGAGADVKMFVGLSPKDARKLFSDFLAVIHRIESLPFPTMATVRGLCLTASLELALAFDFIWASDNATFGQAEATIGVFPFAGGSQRIAARAGSARAKEIVFGGRLYPAATFERWNIINRILPDAELTEKAMTYMRNLADNGPTVAIRSAKKIINAYNASGIAESDRLMIELAGPIFETEDVKTGVDSLLKNGPGKAKFAGK
jgi:enoyl-CoA hydratase/carnithine racemase